MSLPAGWSSTVARFVARFPLPQGAAGSVVHEDACRDWMKRVAEQIEHDFPGQGVGRKRASRTRPWSKDGLPQSTDGGRTIRGWDLMVGAGTGRPTLTPAPATLDLTGQYWEAVSPINHLTPVVQPPEVPNVPTPPPPSTADPTVLATLQRIEALAAQQLEELRAIRRDVPLALQKAAESIRDAGGLGSVLGGLFGRR
jgi:hypothetical protein